VRKEGIESVVRAICGMTTRKTNAGHSTPLRMTVFWLVERELATAKEEADPLRG
jgi:hypothetical protein